MIEIVGEIFENFDDLIEPIDDNDNNDKAALFGISNDTFNSGNQTSNNTTLSEK